MLSEKTTREVRAANQLDDSLLVHRHALYERDKKMCFCGHPVSRCLCCSLKLGFCCFFMILLSVVSQNLNEFFVCVCVCVPTENV